MRKLVTQYKRDPGVRDLAVRLVQPLAQSDYTGEVVTLHQFVRDCIRYVMDTSEVETLQTPPHTLEIQAGDCDDKASLLAALLEGIGHKTRFVAGAFDAPGAFSHVWVETLVGSVWWPLETTRNVPAGWEPSGVVQRMTLNN